MQARASPTRGLSSNPRLHPPAADTGAPRPRVSRTRKAACRRSHGRRHLPAQDAATLEHAQQIAAHESPRTTKLYDRTSDQITLDEIERIAI